MANNINVKLKEIDGINVLDIDDNRSGNRNNNGTNVDTKQAAPSNA